MVQLNSDWTSRTSHSFWSCTDYKPMMNTFLHRDNFAGGCRYWFIRGSQWGTGLGVWCCYHLGSWHGVSYIGKWNPHRQSLFLSGSSSVTSLPNACFLTVALHLQANTYDELPEQLLARLSHIKPSAVVYPNLENISWVGQINLCRFFHSFPTKTQTVSICSVTAAFCSSIEWGSDRLQQCTSSLYLAFIQFWLFLGSFFITLLV